MLVVWLEIFIVVITSLLLLICYIGWGYGVMRVGEFLGYVLYGVDVCGWVFTGYTIL